jgi:acetyl-CoA synthetase
MESRIFAPPAAFVEQANVSGMAAYKALCDEAERDYEGFWARLARENVEWQTPFTRTLNEDNAPFYKWFEDGKLNVSYNCLDRNIKKGLGDKTAILQTLSCSCW